MIQLEVVVPPTHQAQDGKISMADIVNTSKVIERRQLHFNSLDDILADVERLAESKNIRTLGNWSAGEVLQHLAIVMNKSIDGFVARPQAAVRWALRLLFKHRFLTKPMSAGFKLPAHAQAEIGPRPTSLDEGIRNTRQAVTRLKTETKRAPHAVFGP